MSIKEEEKEGEEYSEDRKEEQNEEGRGRKVRKRSSKGKEITQCNGALSR